jgi:DnaJ family protein C protein 28
MPSETDEPSEPQNPPPPRKGPLTPEAAAERMRRRSAGVDDAIRRAVEEGAFDNLPGKGKPLRWVSDQAAGDMALAFHMLANAGYSPDWISRNKELRAEIEGLAQRIAAFVAWVEAQLAPPVQSNEAVPGDRQTLRTQAEARVAKLRAEIADLNGRIDRYNLVAPVASARLGRFAPDARLSHILDRLDA